MARRAEPARFGIGRRRRIGRSAEFEHLLRQGRRQTMDGFTFYHLARESGPPRLGMLVTRRHAALASERNRIKRCIREAFRLEQERLGAVDLLVRPAFGARAGTALIARLRPLFARIGR